MGNPEVASIWEAASDGSPQDSTVCFWRILVMIGNKLGAYIPSAWSKTRNLLGLALVWSASSSWAFARGVPEIDPGSAASALTLLVGGALLLKPRWWRK